MPKLIKPDTASAQQVADKMNEAAAMIIETMPEIAAILTSGASVIESCCDMIDAQHKALTGDV